jgi:hypothetical protein
MKTRSVLVYFPGYPFDIKALMPSRALAAAAGCLLDAGHATRVCDYGTVNWIEGLLEGKISDLSRSVSESVLADPGINPLHTLHTLWQIRATDKLLARKLVAQCDEIAERLVNQRGLHFAGLMIQTVEDLRYASRIAQRLHADRPKLRVVAFGPVVDLFAESIMRDFREFDCLCVGDVELGLVAFAEKVDMPEAWPAIPNICYRSGNSVVVGERRDGLGLGNYPAPAYEPDTYPALRAGQKLKLFELEDNRGTSAGHASPRPLGGAPLRMKPVSAVCNEMWRIATLFGARAFNLCGTEATASHMTAVAHELLRRRMDVVYSRACASRGMVPAMFGALKTSGCKVMSFSVDSGSQRLLDDYYGRTVTVTELESVIRACRSAGIYTIAQLTYPCPADDYHTRAESIRLIERTRPDAAPVEVPRVLPHSEWFERSTHYGFRFRSEHLLARTVASARKFPMAPHLWPGVPFAMANLSPSQIVGEQRSMVEEFERRGILASAPADLIRLARMAGYDRRERQFVVRVQQDLLRGDSAGIATLVDQFNEAVCVPAKGVALKPYDPSRLVVGN